MVLEIKKPFGVSRQLPFLVHRTYSCAAYSCSFASSGADDYVSVDMASLGEGVKKAEVYIVDRDRNLELDRVEYFTAEHAVQILKLSRYMTVYIKITKE